MSQKRLLLNNWGKNILNELDVFYIWVTDIQKAYPETANIPNINKVKFNWFWNGYNGVGEIDYFIDKKTVCNESGENFSNMSILSNSKRQQTNGRSNCALYNDPNLEELFNKILNMINLPN